MKTIDESGVSSVRMPLRYGVILKSNKISPDLQEDSDRYIYPCLKVIMEKVESSELLKEVYLVETPEWNRLAELLRTGHSAEIEVNPSSLWVETVEEEKEELAKQRFDRVLRSIKLDIIGKRFFERDNVAKTDRKLKLMSETEVDRHWELMERIFRVSQVRFLLMGQVKPYCYRLWVENVIGSPIRRVNLIPQSNTVPLTILTMQDLVKRTRGYGHHTAERWPMLLMYVMLNQQPGLGRYGYLSRIPSVEEGEYETDQDKMSEALREVGYKRAVKGRADECWMYISVRTKRIMHGMYMLESYTQRLGQMEDVNGRIRCIKVSKLVQKVELMLEQFISQLMLEQFIQQPDWVVRWKKLGQKYSEMRARRTARGKTSSMDTVE
jgi:hypothetical protein